MKKNMFSIKYIYYDCYEYHIINTTVRLREALATVRQAELSYPVQGRGSVPGPGPAPAPAPAPVPAPAHLPLLHSALLHLITLLFTLQFGDQNYFGSNSTTVWFLYNTKLSVLKMIRCYI